MAPHVPHLTTHDISQHEPLVRARFSPTRFTLPAPRWHTSRFTKRDDSGSQLLVSTGHVPSGVTLGHFADMLAAQPKKLEYHWMQSHGYAFWLRSADATVPLPEGGDKEHSMGYRGVYVNPSNGIAFPGGFGRGWRKPG